MHISINTGDNDARNVLPHLSQLTEEVLQTLLGHDDARLGEMRAEGALGVERLSRGRL